jgi:DNA processing protein
LIDPDEFEAWFRLVEAPGLGRERLRRLLAAFGSPQAVLDASGAARREVAGPAAATISDDGGTVGERLAAARAWLYGTPGRGVLTLADAAYPAQLLQTPDPPLLLYRQGDPRVLARRGLAIVGSRNASVQGRDNARAFAAALSRDGWTIVSGLALGIDAAAHEGGLAGAGGTIAVLGTGLDRVYPARHRALAHRIAETGVLVSEFAPGMPPLAENFPQRNRIIAGLARGTLVVEAALQSGSLITARLAAEYGREVFALPGSIHSPLARGCHALIRQGAKLVESAQDIVDELQDRPRRASDEAEAPPAEPRSDPVLEALGEDPVSLDALCARTGWPAAELSARLMELELEQRVARLPGGLYQRRHIG